MPKGRCWSLESEAMPMRTESEAALPLRILGRLQSRSSLLHTFNIGSRNNGLRHEVLAFCKSFSLSVFGTWIEEKAQSCLGGGVYDDA
jgi:hypothetical protein